MVRKIGIVFVILLLAILFACSSSHTYHLQGYIEGELRYLSSTVTGYLDQLYVEKGTRVQKGQTIFRLNLNPEQAQLAQAQAQLSNAQQNLANLIKGQRQTILQGIEAQRQQAQADTVLSEQTLKRYSILYSKGFIAKADLDQAIATHRRNQQRVRELEANLGEARLGARTDLIRAQEASVKAAQAEVARLQWIVEQKIIRSPAEALIVDTFFKPGELVNADQAVVSILAPQDTHLLFYAPEPMLGKLKIGQKVTFNCDGCALKDTPATIDFISPQAEYTPPVIYSRESRNKLVFRVEAAIDPKLVVQFNAGQPVDVTIHAN